MYKRQVLARVGEDAEIVLHGLSMGAATVLMVSGERLPEQVKAIIEDCGYTSVSVSYTHLDVYKRQP